MPLVEPWACRLQLPTLTCSLLLHSDIGGLIASLMIDGSILTEAVESDDNGTGAAGWARLLLLGHIQLDDDPNSMSCISSPTQGHLPASS